MSQQNPVPPGAAPPPATGYPHPQPYPPPPGQGSVPPPSYDQSMGWTPPVGSTTSTTYVVQPAPIIVQPGHTRVVRIIEVGPEPTMVTCPNCKTTVVTRVDREISMSTHLCAALLCIIGCWPCIWIPYCTPSCMNANHYCPNCGIFIGSHGSC